MNRLTQEAKNRQAAVKFAIREKNKSFAARKYGYSLSSVKRWCKRYDGTWQSLKERSHRPQSHPKRHRSEEEEIIRKAMKAKFFRYGWDGAYDEACQNGYTRSFSGMIYAARRMGLVGGAKDKKPPKKHDRRYPELLRPGEKVQIDVKEIPYCCLRGAARRDGKHMYQWTAIDECTRIRFVYGFEEHTPENSVKFLKMLQRVFPFKIEVIQTDNGTEFTYRYISDYKLCPFEKSLEKAGITHKLIPPRTPWHNGKVERSHRNDQRYFYNWETFRSIEELNHKLIKHLNWSNRKTMRTLGRKSPLELLQEKLWAAA
jgi:transposase InsO family protein